MNATSITVLTERTISEKEKMKKPVDLQQFKDCLDAQSLYNVQFPRNPRHLRDFIAESAHREIYANERKLDTDLVNTMSSWRDMLMLGDQLLLKMIRRKVRPADPSKYQTIMYQACSHPLRDDFLMVSGYDEESFPVVTAIVDDFEACDKLLTEGATAEELDNQPPVVYINWETATKMLTFFLCFGEPNAKSLLYNLGHHNIRSMGSMERLYEAVRKLNESIANQAKNQTKTDRKAKPPDPPAQLLKSALDKKMQQKFERGREYNRGADHQPTSERQLFDTRTPFQRHQQSRNQMIDEQYEQHHTVDSQVALMDSYEREDKHNRLQEERDDQLYYAKQAYKTGDSQMPVVKKSITGDHSNQPCFDELAGKICLRDQKKPLACPYSHDPAFLTKYQDTKHIQSNWSKYLSKRLHNPNMEKPPPPRLRQIEEVTDTRVPTVIRPPNLKQSIASRRESSSSAGHFPFGHGEEEEDSN